MNRRNFFKVAGATSAAALAMTVPMKVKAQSATQFEGVISFNHGHEMILSMEDVMDLMEQTKGGAVVAVDIQGGSAHPHSVELDQDSLVQLMSEKQLDTVSTVDAGHKHDVSIVAV